jgi:hypothetical protein
MNVKIIEGRPAPAAPISPTACAAEVAVTSSAVTAGRASPSLPPHKAQLQKLFEFSERTPSAVGISSVNITARSRIPADAATGIVFADSVTAADSTSITPRGGFLMSGAKVAMAGAEDRHVPPVGIVNNDAVRPAVSAAAVVVPGRDPEPAASSRNGRSVRSGSSAVGTGGANSGPLEIEQLPPHKAQLAALFQFSERTLKPVEAVDETDGTAKKTQKQKKANRTRSVGTKMQGDAVHTAEVTSVQSPRDQKVEFGVDVSSKKEVKSKREAELLHIATVKSAREASFKESHLLKQLKRLGVTVPASHM